MNKPCVMLALSSAQLAQSMQQALEGTAHAVPCVSEADERDFLAALSPDVVIVDAPGDGGEMTRIQRLRELGVPLVLVADGMMTRASGVEYLEVDDILERPFSDFRLINCVVTLTRLYRSEQNLARSAQTLSAEAIEARDAFIGMFCSLIEYRNQTRGHHLDRMQAATRLLLTSYAKLFPERSPQSVTADSIVQASILHDIGSVGVPDAILLKPGRLTPEEYDIMKKHTTVGTQSLAWPTLRPGDPLIDAARDITASHHERWDGTGYPEGLRGEQIPFAARVVAVCDVLDALLGPRVYRREMSFDEALGAIAEGRGTSFDPDLVDALLAARESFELLYRAMPPSLER